MNTTLHKYPTLTEALAKHTPADNPDQAAAKVLETIHVRYPTATHGVLFVNNDFSSSQFGKWLVLAIGPDCTYKTVEEIKPQDHLFDLPSQRMYPIAYIEIVR